MTKREETLNKHRDLPFNSHESDLGAIHDAMEEHAIEFFKWYGIKMYGYVDYITKVKPLVTSNEIEERMKDFEGSTFEELYKKFNLNK